MTSVLPPARRTRPPSRRELILAAATELFAARGYEYVGMSEIAEEVAVQPSAPPGATGLAQCAELVWQLRGEAGQRQVEGASVALQHSIGLGGAAVVTLYEKVS